MAIYSIGNYLLNVNFALGTGLQTSSVTLIGRSYGEGVYDRLKAYRRQIIKIGMLGAAVLAVLFISCGGLFFRFFSDDPAFVRTGHLSCIFIGVIAIFQTLKFCNNGALQGVGKMKEVAFCSIVAYSCVNLGLVALLVLVFHWGIWGVWTGTLCSQASQALMLRYFISKTPVFRRDASLPESDLES